MNNNCSECLALIKNRKGYICKLSWPIRIKREEPYSTKDCPFPRNKGELAKSVEYEEPKHKCYVCGEEKRQHLMRYSPGKTEGGGIWRCDNGACEIGGSKWLKHQRSLPEDNRSEFFEYWENKK